MTFVPSTADCTSWFAGQPPWDGNSKPHWGQKAASRTYSLPSVKIRVLTSAISIGATLSLLSFGIGAASLTNPSPPLKASDRS